MKKVRLDLDALGVDSFDTTPAPRIPRGTVHAAAETDDKTVCWGSCDIYCTVWSCAPPETCYHSCCPSCSLVPECPCQPSTSCPRDEG